MRANDQSPEVLASRGGLCPGEMLAVIEPESRVFEVRRAFWFMAPEQSVPRLKEALAAWAKTRE